MSGLPLSGTTPLGGGLSVSRPWTPPADAQEVAFEAFHAENPHVFDKLLEIARFVKGRGHQRFGVAALFERLRWISLFQTVGDDFKLNNNFRAYYARLLNQISGVEGMFEVRTSRADSPSATATTAADLEGAVRWRDDGVRPG